MPIYEYECPSCGARSEEIRKIPERNQSLQCTNCGSNAVRVFSSPNLLSDANSRPSNDLSPSALPVAGSQITNCTFENSPVGISLPAGANITIKNNKFKNVGTKVEIRRK